MSRRARTLLLPFVVVVGSAAAALAFFSCDGGKSTTSSEGESTTIEDPTQPSTVALAGTGEVTVPPGAFEAGTTLAAKPTDTPETFTAAEGVTQASPALEVSATDAEGAELSTAQVPMTIALNFEEPAALADVEKVAANICVFALTKDGAFVVWRPSTVVLDEAAKLVKYDSKWLGVFQLFYCGDAEIPGATFADKDGKQTSAASETSKFLGSCVVKTKVEDKTTTMCQAIVGSFYVETAVDPKFDEECGADADDSTTFKWNAGESCPTEGAIGVCSHFDGTVKEVAIYYYEGSEDGLQAAKTACEQMASAKWYADTTAYEPGIGTASAPDADGGTNTQLQTDTSTSTGPVGSDLPEGAWSCVNDFVCTTHLGEVWVTKTAAERAEECAGGAENVLDGACPTAGVAGICHMQADSTFAYDIYYQSDFSSTCAQQGQWEPL